MKRGKILIVDDSEINRLMLIDMLADEFDVLEAENGKIALDILNHHRQSISLILLDVVMPELDGFALLEFMNQNGMIQEIPVLMISSETDNSIIDKAYDLGALDYINRPFNERIVKHRVNSTIMLMGKQKELSRMLAKQIFEKENDNRLMIQILSNIVEFRNGESGLHVLNVSTFTKMIMQRLIQKTNKYSINYKDINIIANASALHDIGKIVIPRSILNKPGRFTDEEFEQMKTHSAEGARMLEASAQGKENLPLIKYGYQICRWHHERYNGKGYPDRLRGEEIPIAAQVVSLADVYDALTSKRVYKDAFTHENAVKMILNGECGQFNPLLLECLEDIQPQLKEMKENNRNAIHSFSEDEFTQIVEEKLKSKAPEALKNLPEYYNEEIFSSSEFEELTNEVKFIYSVFPEERFALSEWGADYLNLPRAFKKPRQTLTQLNLMTDESINYFFNAIKETTYENPILDDRFQLYINNEPKWCRIIAKSTWQKTDSNSEPIFTGFIGKIADISDIMKEVKQLKTLATKDSLTGLLNHDTAKKHISEILANPSGKSYALAVIDLDNFKHANDRYGHLFGDEVLIFVSKILTEIKEENDIIARIGGDEFIFFTENRPEIKKKFEDLYRAISVYYKDYNIEISMGIAQSGNTVNNFETLFEYADQTMYSIKSNGKHNFCFFENNDE